MIYVHVSPLRHSCPKNFLFFLWNRILRKRTNFALRILLYALVVTSNKWHHTKAFKGSGYRRKIKTNDKKDIVICRINSII